MFQINTPIITAMIRTTRKLLGLLAFLLSVPMCLSAQIDMDDNDRFNQMNPDGSVNKRNRNAADSLGTDKVIPRGITLSVPSESAAFRFRLFTEPSGFIWLKRSLSSISICADRHIGTDNRNARSPNNFLVVLIIAVIIGVLI